MTHLLRGLFGGSASLRLRPWACATALLCLFLTSCISAPTPVQRQNLCDNQASLTNPNVGGEGGIGGTGAPRAGVESGGTGGSGTSRAGVDSGGTGGTGGTDGRGGIGGTGIMAAKPVFGDGGIGGTGIVGVITGFASICVNGLEVQYDPSTPVWDNGLPASASRLAVGQVVSLTTTGSAAQAKARGITVIHALVGPLAAVNASTGQLVVLGQKATAQRPGDLAGLRAGDWVRVSGHRLASGEIVASKVQAATAPADAQAQVRGPLTAITGNTMKVGDTTIQLDVIGGSAGSAGSARSLGSAGLQVGQEVWASGTWNGQVLQAGQLVAQPTRSTLGRVDQVVLEGFIHRLGPREISLGFEPLQLTEQVQIVGGTQAELAVNRRVQINGRVGPDQRITVERLEFSASPGDGGSGGRGGSSGKGASNGNSGKGNSGSNSGSSGSSSSGSGSSGSGSSGGGTSGGGSSGGGGSGGGGGGSGSGK